MDFSNAFETSSQFISDLFLDSTLNFKLFLEIKPVSRGILELSEYIIISKNNAKVFHYRTAILRPFYLEPSFFDIKNTPSRKLV